MGLKQGEKKHSGFNPKPRSPPPNLAVPTAFYFVSKLRAQTPSFGKGWDFQSPVRHPAPRLTLEILMDVCYKSQHFSSAKTRQSQLLLQQKPQKDRSLFQSPRCKSHPCPEMSAHNSSRRRLHKNIAAGIFPTAAKSSLKAGCLAELLFPQINTHNLTQNREAPLWEYSSRLISKKPALIFPPRCRNATGLDRTSGRERRPEHSKEQRRHPGTQRQAFSHHPFCRELLG